MATYATYLSLFSFNRNESEIITAEGTGGSLSSKDEGLVFTSLEEALSLYGLRSLSPTWIPAGFQFREAEVHDLDTIVNIIAVYENDEGGEIMMLVTILSEDDLRSYKAAYEVDENYHDYRSDSPTYYIDSNFDTPLIIGEYQDCVFRISGDVTVNELKQIVNSIPR